MAALSLKSPDASTAHADGRAQYLFDSLHQRLWFEGLGQKIQVAQFCRQISRRLTRHEQERHPELIEKVHDFAAVIIAQTKIKNGGVELLTLDEAQSAAHRGSWPDDSAVGVLQDEFEQHGDHRFIFDNQHAPTNVGLPAQGFDSLLNSAQSL